MPLHETSGLCNGSFDYAFNAMGSACSLRFWAVSREQADIAAAMAVAEVERIEAKYSRYLASSFLSSLNQAAGQGGTVQVDAETAGLLDYAFACFRKSDGLFDITAGVLRRAWNFRSSQLPSDDDIQALLGLIGMDNLNWQNHRLTFSVKGMEIDFGGIGKEYAVDRVAALMVEAGIEHGLINLGGDLVALGPQLDGRPWTIGLPDPHRAGKLLAEVPFTQGALATSGDYERCIVIRGQRFCHILNPHTGWPVSGLSSVTAIAPQCMVAGSVATIAILKEFKGIEWLAERGLPHGWVDVNGKLGGDLWPTTAKF